MSKYNYIYKTTNLINGKIYVGKHSTNNIADRYLGSGYILDNAIKKHGKENFKREILEFCIPCNDYISYRERFWISNFNSTDKNIGYNITKGGNGIFGYKFKEESKLKMSLRKKGKPSKNKGRTNWFKHSEEVKIKIGNSVRGDKNGFYGKTHSEEVKNKISLKHLGKEPVNKGVRGLYKHTEEHKNYISDKFKGDKHPFYGKNHTEETKQKQSLAKKNSPVLICPNCGLQSISAANMYRYHFDNCKSIK